MWYPLLKLYSEDHYKGFRTSKDFVNIIFNRKLGPRIRRQVPHVPIIIEKNIMKGFEL